MSCSHYALCIKDFVQGNRGTPPLGQIPADRVPWNNTSANHGWKAGPPSPAPSLTQMQAISKMDYSILDPFVFVF